MLKSGTMIDQIVVIVSSILGTIALITIYTTDKRKY